MVLMFRNIPIGLAEKVAYDIVKPYIYGEPLKLQSDMFEKDDANTSGGQQRDGRN